MKIIDKKTVAELKGLMNHPPQKIKDVMTVIAGVLGYD